MNASTSPYFTAVLTAALTLIVSVVVAWFTSKRTATFQTSLMREQDRRKALADQYRERRDVYERYLRQWRASYSPTDDQQTFGSKRTLLDFHTAARNARLAERVLLKAQAHIAFDSIEIADALFVALTAADTVGWQFVGHREGVTYPIEEMNRADRIAHEAILAKLSESRVALGLPALSNVKSIAASVSAKIDAHGTLTASLTVAPSSEKRADALPPNKGDT